MKFIWTDGHKISYEWYQPSVSCSMWHWAANTENPRQIYFYSKETKLFTYYNSCFIMCWQRPGLVYQAISYWQNHARMANSQNVAISGKISSAILNIWCRFIGEKVFEIINSQKEPRKLNLLRWLNTVRSAKVWVPWRWSADMYLKV